MDQRDDEIRTRARLVFARERFGWLVVLGPVFMLAYAVVWGVVDEMVPQTWAVALVFAGATAGLVVRFIGRGTRLVFYAVAFFLYLLCVFLAVGLFEIAIGAGAIGRFSFLIWVIGLGACFGLVPMGQTRDERWSLRDNRGLARPEVPEGGAIRTAMGLAGLVLVSFLTLVVGVAFVQEADPASVGTFAGQPSEDEWRDRLARDARLAEEARALGYAYGLSGSDDACRAEISERYAECQTTLCRAQSPYLLERCLETAAEERQAN